MFEIITMFVLAAIALIMSAVCICLDARVEQLEQYIKRMEKDFWLTRPKDFEG